jgi:hypothetical protein
MTTLSVRLRAATKSENKKLRDFYRATETDTLPPPSLSTISKALSAGSLLIVENCADASILATAGYFEYIKSAKRRLIFELAGTRVTKTIGRLQPYSLQQILLASRLFQIAATEGDTRNSVTVISSARHPKSQSNLMSLRMDEIAVMPEWLEYDVCSWTRMSERTQWRHYIATADSVYKAIEILERSGFSTGRLDCTASRVSDAGFAADTAVAVAYDLPIRQLFPSFLLARQRREAMATFTPLPSRLF